MIHQVNIDYMMKKDDVSSVSVDIVNAAELDEMWSFVRCKSNQRWLWLAIEHETGEVLAYTFGRREDIVFLRLSKLLKPLGIDRFYSDNWSSYVKYLDSDKHTIGKANTQRIERKNLTFRTHIKRLTRKTICFSKSVAMHDIVVGLVINFWEFPMFHFSLKQHL